MLAFYLSAVALLAAASTAAPSPAAQPLVLQIQGDIAQDALQHQVLVTLGVMSKCPDAFLMEGLIDRTLKDPSIKGKVDLELLYIGALDKSQPTGVACKHGESECTGNIQQLCVQEHLDQSVWWPFITCQNYFSSRIGSVDLAEQCADVAGFNWEDLKQCVDGHEGANLLQQSVKRVEELGIEKSATLLLGKEHKVRCIHDGVWKSCDAGHQVSDFVRSIKEAWEAKL